MYRESSVSDALRPAPTRSGRAGRLSVVLLLGTLSVSSAAALQPIRLRCEYAVNPLGVDERAPRLSWCLQADERDQRQTAYRVLVASSPVLLRANRGDCWDSGRVASERSLHVVYRGRRLRPGMRLWWKVQVWDKQSRASEFSPPAWWEMGLLGSQNWTGTWLVSGVPLPACDEDRYRDQPAPLFRRTFSCAKRVRRARVYVSGLGYCELRLNGRKVGDQLLDPAWTDYSKRVYYSTYDVTQQLRRGENTLGVMLGNGWYNPLPLRMWGKYNLRDHLPVGAPTFRLQMQIDFADGTRASIATDGRWKTHPGPVLRNSVYLGEWYDARREQSGWDSPGFDDRAWRPAGVGPGPGGKLQAQPVAPVRVRRTLQPVAITQPRPGRFVFDLGENIAGTVTLRVEGRAGTLVRLRYGELLNADGTVNGMTTVCGQIKRPGIGGPGAPEIAYQTDTYVLKGGGPESYSPRFTFHGFRYVEVSGLPARPTRKTLVGHRIGTAVRPVGTFSCSNTMVNRIQRMVGRTVLSNLIGVQSDCPGREKFGYGGDIVATCEAVMLNFDMSRFYAKTVRDFGDAVRPGGGLTETAPYVGIAVGGFGNGSGPIGWGTVHPLLLWHLHQYYGERRLLAEQYEVARRYLEWLDRHASDRLVTRGISDHESLVPKPIGLTGTAFYHANARLLARLARILGRPAEAQRYEARADVIREALNKRFLHQDTGRYDLGTQACQAFALYHDLPPRSHRAAVLNALVDDVLTRHHGHLTTGIFGTKYLLATLSDAGRADVAFGIVRQRSFPGWGYMLDHGATTLWEHWAWSDNVYSHNHPMFGSVSEWFYKTLAGIAPAADAIGFDSMVVRPRVVGDLMWVRARYESVRGTVASAWRLADGRFRLDLEIPVGIRARVELPVSSLADVREGGRPVDQVPSVRVCRQPSGAAFLQVGAGHYRFESPYRQAAGGTENAAR